MSFWSRRLHDLHRLCVDQLVYPLILSSVLACILYYGRDLVRREQAFDFLTWNLFLAWIPYLCSLGITLVYRRLPQLRGLLILPALIWLIFLPNAPYIVTDMLHLNARSSVPIWYDIGLVATFAWTGCFLCIVSLNQMQAIVRRLAGSFVSWLFAFGAIGLSGLGIYLGRFLKFNSWDLFLHPRIVLYDTASLLAHPAEFRQPLGVTLLFAAFLLVCYLTFVAIEHRQFAYRGTE
jgi:uncharacterized membrane protein